MKKSVAVLANGPSLKVNWTDRWFDRYDIVIAINTAGWIFKATHWAYLDKAVFQDRPPEMVVPEFAITHEKMLIGKGVQRIVPDLYNKKKKSVEEWHGVIGYMGEAIAQCNYTFPCALGEASRLAKGGQVDVYGFDMALNSVDVCGKGGDRGESRWRRELPWVKHVWLPYWKIIGNCPMPIAAWLAGEIDMATAWQGIGK